MISDELQRSEWKGGQLLAFSALDGVTDYGSALTARTAFDGPGIDVKLPGCCRIRFPQTADTRNIVAGDWFCLGEDRMVRGVFLDSYHLLMEGPCEVSDAESSISFLTEGNRTLVGPSSHLDASRIAVDIDAALRDRSRWLETRRLPVDISPATRRTLIKALSVLKTQVYSPEGPIRHRWTTPDRWPHQRMWLWDSAFHAIGWRHVDPELARDAVLAMFDVQGPDGFMMYMMDPIGTTSITQPPILALSAKLVHDAAPAAGWIEDLYPRLCAYIEWDLKNRDSDGSGLVGWAIGGENIYCRGGESGMDNSPRFDVTNRMHAVDFNSFIALECEILAEFALALGLDGDAKKWRAKQAELNHLIATHLWSEELGFFVDYDIDRQTLSSVAASPGFLPLICGAASEEQAARLAECLADPTMFGTAFPVPSVAARDVQHYAKDMWRGPVWINFNWLIAWGFDRYGFGDVAARLRSATMKEVEKWFEEYGVLFEFYDDRCEVAPPELLRKGKCAPEDSPYHQVFHDYGWTASLYVDLVYSANNAVAS